MNSKENVGFLATVSVSDMKGVSEAATREGRPTAVSLTERLTLLLQKIPVCFRGGVSSSKFNCPQLIMKIILNFYLFYRLRIAEECMK